MLTSSPIPANDALCVGLVAFVVDGNVLDVSVPHVLKLAGRGAVLVPNSLNCAVLIGHRDACTRIVGKFKQTGMPKVSSNRPLPQYETFLHVALRGDRHGGQADILK